MPPAFNLSQDQTLQFKPVTVFGSVEPVAHSKLTGYELLHKPDLLSCETLDTFAFANPERFAASPSSAHTYRLLVVKDRIACRTGFHYYRTVSFRVAASAAEKRDYEELSLRRQQVFLTSSPAGIAAKPCPLWLPVFRTPVAGSAKDRNSSEPFAALQEGNRN
jgi:hypothetical protein